MFECYCIDRIMNPDQKHDCIFTWVDPNGNGQNRTSHYRDKVTIVPIEQLFVFKVLPDLKKRKSKARELYT